MTGAIPRSDHELILERARWEVAMDLRQAGYDELARQVEGGEMDDAPEVRRYVGMFTKGDGTCVDGIIWC
jgi:hypothetical protein